jgi:hypothetical protein
MTNLDENRNPAGTEPSKQPGGPSPSGVSNERKVPPGEPDNTPHVPGGPDDDTQNPG